MNVLPSEPLLVPSTAPATTGGGPVVVAVEATRLAREVRGIGRYVRALLPRLVAIRPGVRVRLYAKNARDVAILTAWLETVPELHSHAEVGLVRDMVHSKADVFWYPWNVATPTPRHGAVVVTMHDVVPLAHPDPRWQGTIKNLRWRRRFSKAAARATLVIADSAFTADEIHRVLDYPRDRMRVVLLAADDFVVPPSAGDSAALERLGIHSPFVLAVGAADRRKNLELVDRAMPGVVAAHPEIVLALAGPRRAEQVIEQEPAWKRTLGFVTEEELAALYRAAEVLVMPSTYEGFGLPVLEAMRMGTPVICARASSLPEVAGDAAAWVDPNDAAAVTRAINQLLSDKQLGARMRAASLAQSARFTWDETARKTMAAFDEAIAIAAIR
ncbi:MAG: glycosyltransferase [Gemmatimonadetes bacterium]|nr:glycosyltransferase [Gemmatimonadota bacterium]